MSAASIWVLLDVVRISETSVYSSETTRCYIPEGSHIYITLYLLIIFGNSEFPPYHVFDKNAIFIEGNKKDSGTGSVVKYTCLVLPYENIQLCLTDTCYLEGIG
jgi:hypothetical protein